MISLSLELLMLYITANPITKKPRIGQTGPSRCSWMRVLGLLAGRSWLSRLQPPSGDGSIWEVAWSWNTLGRKSMGLSDWETMWFELEEKYVPHLG